MTRRQTTNRPDGPFTLTFAARPEEQVQIDWAPIDVMVLLESGMTVRSSTLAVDVATKTITTAALRAGRHQSGGRGAAAARMLVSGRSSLGT